MFRKLFLSMAVLMGLALAGCATPTTTGGADVATQAPAITQAAGVENANDAVNANTAPAETAYPVADDNANTNTAPAETAYPVAGDNGNASADANANAAPAGTAYPAANDNASGATTPAAPAGVGQSGNVTIETLITALRQQGLEASVAQFDWSSYNFGDLPAGHGRKLSINGETAYAIEFPDATTAQAVYQGIQSGGFALGEFIKPRAYEANANEAIATAQALTAQNVYVVGRLMVIYPGNNPETMQMLQQMAQNGQ